MSLPPQVTAWLLLEHPGPWGPDRAGDSPLIPASLRDSARERGIRIHFIRRYAQRPHSIPSRTFLVSTRTGFTERLYTHILNDSILDALVAGRPSGMGVPVDRPLYLTCTHGRFDVMCAQMGRPIARALANLVGDRAWETTHVSGCHLAANIVCLPTGTYYGRVTVADVPAIVAATEAGEIAEPWFRGHTQGPQGV